MFSAFKKFGKLGALASSVARAWSPLSLWPNGIASPGMWISPRTLTSEWQDYTGTTPVVTPGTVADSSNPVGLALDIRAGATVLTDPGNHMLQSTSAARPLMSARVNLLTYTEDFSNAVWNKDNVSASSPGVGGRSTLTATATPGQHRVYQLCAAVVSGISVSHSIIAEYENNPWVFLEHNGHFAYFNVQTGVIGNVDAIFASTSITANVDGGYVCTASLSTESTDYLIVGLAESNGVNNYTAAGTEQVTIRSPQLSRGLVPQTYQSVPGDGSTYATDFPIFQKYDGVDDGMATATFTAGTLIDGMDCMIPVRRDSAAACVAGLYNGIADATKFFGMAESGSGSGCVGSGAGTPTVWVDRVQLSGGTAVTRGTLHTALTVGDYHILEFRGLDLSTWTAAGFGLYTSYVFPGARGDILLYPSTASTEDKDAARQYLADYYGVTLP